MPTEPGERIPQRFKVIAWLRRIPGFSRSRRDGLSDRPTDFGSSMPVTTGRAGSDRLLRTPESRPVVDRTKPTSEAGTPTRESFYRIGPDCAAALQRHPIPRRSMTLLIGSLACLMGEQALAERAELVSEHAVPLGVLLQGLEQDRGRGRQQYEAASGPLSLSGRSLRREESRQRPKAPRLLQPMPLAGTRTQRGDARPTCPERARNSGGPAALSSSHQRGATAGRQSTERRGRPRTPRLAARSAKIPVSSSSSA
jgi:hypothetical protein